MCSNHHTTDDRGHIDPLRVEDGVDQVCRIIGEATLMSGNEDVVGDDPM